MGYSLFLSPLPKNVLFIVELALRPTPNALHLFLLMPPRITTQARAVRQSRHSSYRTILVQVVSNEVEHDHEQGVLIIPASLLYCLSRLNQSDFTP